ncbi:MAG: TonB-dependent receptor plug domain-containing protein [Prevotella sp.]|nr:TonB-dependent receptor plug domain-containing protein [Candidatus Prevotella equi]
MAQKTQQLEEVQIISHQTFRDVIPSQSMNGKTLEKLNSLNVADALRYFSGLQVKDYGGVGGIKTVNIRSMGSQHLGVYYDGIELGNAQNGQIDLGQFSLDNIEEVTLYNGQRSSLMQTASDYGNAGSVYLRTRMPRFRVGETWHLKAKAKYGISNMLNIGLLYEQKLSEWVSASLSVGGITSDGKYQFRYRRKNYDGSIAYDTTAIRQNGDVQSLRAELNLNGVINRGGWNFKAYTYQSNRGIPGAIVNNVWRREERQVDSNTFLQGSIQKDFSAKYSARVMAKYANYYTHYQNRDTTTMLVDNKYRQQELYLSTSHAVQLLPWWSASMAYDMRWSKLTADNYNCPEPYRWSHLVSLATAVNVKRFSAQASVLYTYAKDKGQSEKTGGTAVGANLKISRFTPALFLNYRLYEKTVIKDEKPSTTRLSLRGYVKNSFRMPTFNDLYYAEIGNSNLRPENAQQFDGGVLFDKSYATGILESIHFQSDVYYNDVTDKIIAYPKGQQFRWTMLNLGRVNITGVDVETAFRFRLKQVHTGLRLQYTYQKSIDVTSDDDSFYRNQIPYIPRNSGSVMWDVEWKGLSFNYAFIYTGERYSQQENTVWNYLQPWYTSDLSLAYRFKVRRTMMRATFEVNNLFSQDYDVILNYPMPKRNYAFSFDIEI